MHKTDRRRRHSNCVAPGSIQGDVLAVDESQEQHLDAIDEWWSYRHDFLLANLISDRGIGPQPLSDWFTDCTQICDWSVRRRAFRGSSLTAGRAGMTMRRLDFGLALLGMAVIAHAAESENSDFFRDPDLPTVQM